jgi:hypothetical protein
MHLPSKELTAFVASYDLITISKLIFANKNPYQKAPLTKDYGPT